MQIPKIQSNNNIHFSSLAFNWVCYTDAAGKRRETQNTTCVREDLDYDVFAKTLKNRFKEHDKINLRLMNVSDGTEAYLIANSILKVFGKKEAEERIFPIQAGDVCSFVIDNYGKQGVVALTEEEKLLFGENFEKYFTEIPFDRLPKSNYLSDSKAYELNPQFKKYFSFYTEDFQKTLRSLPKDEGNTVISIRNCLRQSFSYPERGLIISNIHKILKNASLFVIGGYDRKHIMDYLEIFGFKEITKNIFGLKNYVETNSPLEVIPKTSAETISPQEVIPKVSAETISSQEVIPKVSAESIITPIIEESKNTIIQQDKRRLTKIPLLSKLKKLLKLK